MRIDRRALLSGALAAAVAPAPDEPGPLPVTVDSFNPVLRAALRIGDIFTVEGYPGTYRVVAHTSST